MLSTEGKAKLLAWIRPSTWHTTHDLDMERWYRFVNQYQLDNGFSIDETVLREQIEHLAGCEINEELREEICDRISLAYKIFDFLRVTGR